MNVLYLSEFGGGIIVASADQIVEGASKLGATFNKRTLFNYTAANCLPEPKRGAGYGGKWVEYTDFDVVWATVAWRMIHGVYLRKDINTSEVSISIKDIKPPRVPPKTIGLLHKCTKLPFHVIL